MDRFRQCHGVHWARYIVTIFEIMQYKREAHDGGDARCSERVTARNGKMELFKDHRSEGKCYVYECDSTSGFADTKLFPRGKSNAMPHTKDVQQYFQYPTPWLFNRRVPNPSLVDLITLTLLALCSRLRMSREHSPEPNSHRINNLGWTLCQAGERETTNTEHVVEENSRTNIEEDETKADSEVAPSLRRKDVDLCQELIGIRKRTVFAA